MQEGLESWFRREVLVHEDMLMRFLARAWPNHSDLTDLRQETYIRICEAAANARPQSPKAYLFSVAKHIMADRRRRERIVSIQSAGDSDFSNDLVDEETPERLAGARQELARLAHAFDRLPEQCRKIVWMRRVLDLPQRDVALRLGLSERTIEGHVQRGSRLLAQYMFQPISAAARGNAREKEGKDTSDETNEQDLP